MSEDRELAKPGVGNLCAFLVAREIRAAAGIDDEARPEGFHRLIRTAAFDPEATLGLRQTSDLPALSHGGSGAFGSLEEEMVESRPLNLKRILIAVETSGPKIESRFLGAIGGVELGAPLPGEAGGHQRVPNTQFVENAAVVGQERFPDVEARERVFLQQHDSFARFGEVVSGRRARRPPADHDGVKWSVLLHKRSATGRRVRTVVPEIEARG